MALFRRKDTPEPTAIGIDTPDGSFDAPLFEGWQPIDSDIAARMYRNDMQLLFNFGAGGAIRGIKGTMSRFERQGSSARDFMKRTTGSAANFILQPIQQEIYNVLALAVQGHFEKGFRRWLRNSLQFVDQTAISDEDIVKSQWSNPNTPKRDLGCIMASLRGIHLRDVVEGPLLLELALIGNVVRHGDGPSALQAYQRFPFLFDPVVVFDDDPAVEEDEEIPERLRVNEERLALYAQAAFQFWHRVQLAYTGDA
ncbi:MAG: hypothetical protein K2X59_00605 [Sphingomonas sp.]|nr:hypothetical protein [Sphingomonas sp.]